MNHLNKIPAWQIKDIAREPMERCSIMDKFGQHEETTLDLNMTHPAQNIQFVCMYPLLVQTCMITLLILIINLTVT